MDAYDAMHRRMHDRLSEGFITFDDPADDPSIRRALTDWRDPATVRQPIWNLFPARKEK